MTDVDVAETDVVETDVDEVMPPSVSLSAYITAKNAKPTTTKTPMTSMMSGNRAVKTTTSPARQPLLDLSFCGIA